MVCALLLFWNITFNNLPQISFGNRKTGAPFMGCYISVDGVDCSISEPSPFSSKWWPHKLNRAGLRYEIGISICTGLVMWASRPWPCGSNSDVLVFRSGLKRLLESSEFVVADSSYIDVKCVQPSGLEHPLHVPIFKIRARHEGVNGRMREFFVCLTDLDIPWIDTKNVSLQFWMWCTFTYYIP